MTINNLPKWDLTEIYINSNDPKIDLDIQKVRNSILNFEKKWKGHIRKLSGKEIAQCLKQFEKIHENAGTISTHSSLSFASNMLDPKITQYNAKISDFFSDVFSKLVFVSLEIGSVSDKVFKMWSTDKNIKKWIPIINNLRKRK